MTPFVAFPWLTVFVFVIVVLVLLSALAPKRPPQFRPPQASDPAAPPTRICFFCKTEHAAYATFCKTCGKRL